MEGSSVTLHCEVDSNPAARISWMFGDQELLWDTAANVSLALDDMSAAQEGVYTCVGDNGYGAMNASLYLSIKCKTQSTPPTASRSNHSASSGRAQVLRHPYLCPTSVWLPPCLDRNNKTRAIRDRDKYSGLIFKLLMAHF
jgi:myelin associated glycoprotein